MSTRYKKNILRINIIRIFFYILNCIHCFIQKLCRFYAMNFVNSKHKNYKTEKLNNFMTDDGVEKSDKNI